eukprot:g46.t1
MRKGTDKDWEERSGCMTFPDAVAKALKAKGQDPAKWLQDARKMSLDQMRKAAAGMGCDIFFDWDSARSVEGYFRIKGSTEFCIERAIAFAPYADSIWMETGKPILAQATQFAKEVRAAVPHQMLAYNLSPSFNWDSAGMTDGQMESFIWDLAKLGFCWQFITLAGFHCDALNIDLFAKEYSKRGAAAYVQMIQREERKHKVETLTHQKWSGSEIVDEMGNIVSGGLSSTGIMNVNVGAQGAVRHVAGPAAEDAIARLRAERLNELDLVTLVHGGLLAEPQRRSPPSLLAHSQEKLALTVTEIPYEVLQIFQMPYVGDEQRHGTLMSWLTRLHAALLHTVRAAGYRSVSMPTLCTGGIGIPVQFVAVAAVRSVYWDFCAHPTDPMRVRLCCFELGHLRMARAVKMEVLDHFYRPEHILAGDAAVSGGLEMRAVSSNEDADFQARVKVMKEFMSSERFKHTTRPYKVEDVVKLQGTFPMYFNGAKVSEKLYKMLREHQAKGTCSHTFGALDTVQAGDGGGCSFY